MARDIASLIRQLKPGKHFLGLWVYRQWHHRQRPPKWVVTFFDYRGEYYETALHPTAVGALREAKRILYPQD